MEAQESAPLSLVQWETVRDQGTLVKMTLGPGQLHLWRAELDGWRQESIALEGLLSPGERERAGRLKFDELRERYVAGRGLLRRVLSRYAGIAPEDLLLVSGRSGKPALAGPVAGRLQFSLTHTNDLLLILVSAGRSVGVDVEQIRLLDGEEAILSLLFRQVERSRIRRLSPADRTRVVLRAWTLKEALGKADGDGLADALRWAHLRVDPGSCRPLSTQRCCVGNRCYHAVSITLGDVYLGALAVQIVDDGADPIGQLETYDLVPSYRPSQPA